jgi:hypothetical protein
MGMDYDRGNGISLAYEYHRSCWIQNVLCYEKGGRRWRTQQLEILL